MHFTYFSFNDRFKCFRTFVLYGIDLLHLQIDGNQIWTQDENEYASDGQEIDPYGIAQSMLR